MDRLCQDKYELRLHNSFDGDRYPTSLAKAED